MFGSLCNSIIIKLSSLIKVTFKPLKKEKLFKIVQFILKVHNINSEENEV